MIVINEIVNITVKKTLMQKMEEELILIWKMLLKTLTIKRLSIEHCIVHKNLSVFFLN